MKEKEQKMQGKYYIACRILSLLCIAGMLIAAIMNISGYTAASFFIGVLYVITICKVPKKGAVNRKEVKKYELFDKASIPTGNGGIICMERQIPLSTYQQL